MLRAALTAALAALAAAVVLALGTLPAWRLAEARVFDLVSAAWHPLPPEPDAHAVEAALAMVAAVERLNGELAAEGVAPLSIGVGVNTGDCVVANLGSRRRFDYRERTRPEAFFAFAVEAGRAARQPGIDCKPIQGTLDRISEIIEKAKSLADSLLPWKEKKRIEPPKKQLPPPSEPFEDDTSL